MADAPETTKEVEPDHLRTKEVVGPYTIHRFVSSAKIIEDTDIEGSLLHDAVVEQSGLAAFYGGLHAKATRQASMLKMNVDAIIAKIDAEIREAAVKDGKKLTEKAIESQLDGDKRVLAARKALIVAEEVKDTLFAACMAIAQRRDTLEILGRFQNEEWKGTLRIVQQDATRSKANNIRDRLANISKAA